MVTLFTVLVILNALFMVENLKRGSGMWVINLIGFVFSLVGIIHA
jgi:hypothetical protein